MEGDFGIDAARFTNPGTQEGIGVLSESARGKPPDDDDKEKTAADAESLLSDLKGHVVLQNGIATFTRLSFGVPGAHAEMHGTYDLISEKIDLAGVSANASKAIGRHQWYQIVPGKSVEPISEEQSSPRTPAGHHHWNLRSSQLSRSEHAQKVKRPEPALGSGVSTELTEAVHSAAEWAAARDCAAVAVVAPAHSEQEAAAAVPPVVAEEPQVAERSGAVGAIRSASALPAALRPDSVPAGAVPAWLADETTAGFHLPRRLRVIRFRLPVRRRLPAIRFRRPRSVPLLVAWRFRCSRLRHAWLFRPCSRIRLSVSVRVRRPWHFSRFGRRLGPRRRSRTILRGLARPRLIASRLRRVVPERPA